MSIAEKKLSKKQQKVLAFRSRYKQKVTDNTLNLGKDNSKDEQKEAYESETKKSTKRNIDDVEDNTNVKKEKIKKQKRIAKEAKNGEIMDGNVDGETFVGKHKKSRLIVFVGNLPFDATVEQIKKHFDSAGGILSIRLITDKLTKKSKGFAFMEFEDTECMHKALNFHHTIFRKRQINVELTAGGGGNTETRKQKITKKNEKLDLERKKYHDKEIAPKKAERVASSYGRIEAVEEKPPKITGGMRPPRGVSNVNAIKIDWQNRLQQSKLE